MISSADGCANYQEVREDVMRRSKILEASLAAAVVTFSAGYGYADESSAGSDEFSARLSGFNEIGSISATGYTGAILSDGSGTVTLHLNKNSIDYTLKYSNVGTTAPLIGSVLFAHIHFGKSRDSGGILVFFCTNVPFTGSGPTPPSCNTDSSGSGTVSGTWTKDNVQKIAGQNVNAGDFDALVDALNSNTAYANIHTTALTGGEIRGQCRSEDREHRDN
jgi:hypothetical protein